MFDAELHIVPIGALTPYSGLEIVDLLHRCHRSVSYNSLISEGPSTVLQHCRPKFMTLYRCPYCSCRDEIPASVDKCPACHRELTAPNVRIAETTEEINALNARLAQADAEATARNCINQLNDFGVAVMSSAAAICRPLQEIKRLVSSNLLLYNTFYDQVSSDQRLPEANEYDQMRESVDALIFPNYHKRIVFAALTLNDNGAVAYGGHAIILKEDTIKHRASVFETNTFEFAKKHNLGVNTPCLKGYRASWSNRHILAKAKLYPLIDKNVSSKDYPGILLRNDAADKKNDDFIEVHIYGGFNRGAIDKLTINEVKNPADKLIIKSISKDAASCGIQVNILNKIAKAA